MKYISIQALKQNNRSCDLIFLKRKERKKKPYFPFQCLQAYTI